MPPLLADPARSHPVLPPSFRLVTLRERDDAFRHACRLGADAVGTLVWVPRFHLLELAVVLGPDEPLRSARRAFYVGMAALAYAVGAYAPPDKPVQFVWPDTLLFDRARLGGGRLGWPEGCGEDDTPDWLVFSAMVLLSKHGAGDSGLTPGSTSLEDEGCEGQPGDLVGSFARHLLRGFHLWSDEGFDAIGTEYTSRLAEPETALRPRLAENGDLLFGHPAKRLELGPALNHVGWLDARAGRPRL